MRKKIVLRNILYSIVLQIITIISGFIIPKVILSCFGSDVNGLVSSINQFLNYITLLEGGMTGVIMSSLYKPLAEGNQSKVSGIINATESFFRKIGLLYIVYVICLAFVYPLFVKSVLNYWNVLVLVLVIGINLFVQYYFSLTYRILLNADQKSYFVSMVQILMVTANMILVLVTAHFFKNIIVIKLAGVVAFLLQPILYHIYVKRNFKLDRTLPKDNNSLKQRWNGFGQNVAYFIHTNTDIVVLTLLASLADISIYAVYAMVINALRSLIISISSAIVPSFGNVLSSGNFKKINEIFNIIEFGITFISTLLFSCGILLVAPFVVLYTKNIIDANYYQPVFGGLLAVAEMIYCIRDPYISTAYAMGHFRQTSKYAYLEAGLNIVISVIFVSKYGIIGVAIGTVSSMLYRLFAHIFYLKNNILYRPIKRGIKNIAVFGGTCFIICVLSYKLFDFEVSNYIEWCFLGVKVFIISFCGLVLVSIMFYLSEIKHLIHRKVKGA